MNAGTFQTDSDYLPELHRLITAGHVRLDFDAARLRGMDSPVAVEAEVMWWAMFILAVSVAAFWWGGWETGGIALLASSLIYLTVGRRWLAGNLRRRIMETGLREIGVWRKLWRHGGITLTEVGDGSAVCRAPDESWLRFVDSVLKRAAETRG